MCVIHLWYSYFCTKFYIIYIEFVRCWYLVGHEEPEAETDRVGVDGRGHQC